MNFKFPKRNATFGDAFKNRPKKEGGEKTITLKVSHSVSPKELDMLIPVATDESVLVSHFLFGEDKKKPALQTYVMFPLQVNRHPEAIEVTIFDQKTPLKFDKVDVTDIIIDIDEDGKKMTASYNLQIHPGKSLQRISEYIEGNTIGYSCVNTQEELFGEEAEEREEPEDPADPPPVKDGDGFNDDDDDEDD